MMRLSLYHLFCIGYVEILLLDLACFAGCRFANMRSLFEMMHVCRIFARLSCAAPFAFVMISLDRAEIGKICCAIFNDGSESKF